LQGQSSQTAWLALTIIIYFVSASFNLRVFHSCVLRINKVSPQNVSKQLPPVVPACRVLNHAGHDLSLKETDLGKREESGEQVLLSVSLAFEGSITYNAICIAK